MDISELERCLRDAGYRPDSYDFIGDDTASDTLVLRSDHSGWTVYYAERGLQTGKRIFVSEAEAFEYFLGLISRDPTAKKT